MLRHGLWIQAKAERERLIDVELSGLVDSLRFGRKVDARLAQAEQSPRLGLEVDAVEARKRNVLAMQLHRSTKHDAVLRQRILQSGNAQAHRMH